MISLYNSLNVGIFGVEVGFKFRLRGLGFRV